jgi:prolyl-tRNA synthetase
VPLRIEFGPRDATAGVVTTVRRDNGSKETVSIEKLAEGVQKVLNDMQKAMFDKAKAEFDAKRKIIHDWNQIVPTLNKKELVTIASCLDGPCIEAVKSETAALAKTDQDGPEDKKAPSMGCKYVIYEILYLIVAD